MGIENFQYARHSLVSSVDYRTHRGWVWRTIFKIKVLRRLENAIMGLVLQMQYFISSSVVAWIVLGAS